MEQLTALSKACGFSEAAIFSSAGLEYREEVRDMCASNRCGAYGKRWVCPPACGSLEEIRARVRRFAYGCLLQTVVQLDDPFDYEAMREGMDRHRRQLEDLVDRCRRMGIDLLPMGADGCGRCDRCTYPVAPCRFPDRAFLSMEACGLVVSDVCAQAGLRYNYGPHLLAYCALVLVNKAVGKEGCDDD